MTARPNLATLVAEEPEPSPTFNDRRDDSRDDKDRRRDQIAALIGPLRTITQSKHRVSSLTLERDGAWVFFERSVDPHTFVARAPSSRHLPSAESLDTTQAGRLRAMGWTKSPHTRCFERSFRCDEVGMRSAAGEALTILQDVYRRSTGPGLIVDVFHDDHEPPTNDAIVQHMRALASGWDEQRRRTFYQDLVNATLIVPVLDPGATHAGVSPAGGTVSQSATESPRDPAPSSQPASESSPHESWRRDDDEGRSVLAFTDWSTFRRFDPRGQLYETWQGAELIEAMPACPTAQLKINVAGEVGGSLLIPELDMLRAAVRQWRAR